MDLFIYSYVFDSSTKNANISRLKQYFLHIFITFKFLFSPDDQGASLKLLHTLDSDDHDKDGQLKELESFPPYDSLLIEEAKLTTPPNVPPPIKRSYPVRLVVKLESQIASLPLRNGQKYRAWAFNRSVPGPFIRVNFLFLL